MDERDMDPAADPSLLEDLTVAWLEWFAVRGDMDDFIFYGEPEKPHSER